MSCLVIVVQFFQAQATRERPRTGSQTSSSAMPVSVAPPPGQVQAAPQPAPQPKPPSVDLLGDLGGDPFAQQRPQGNIFVDFKFRTTQGVKQTFPRLFQLLIGTS